MRITEVRTRVVALPCGISALEAAIRWAQLETGNSKIEIRRSKTAALARGYADSIHEPSVRNPQSPIAGFSFAFLVSLQLIDLLALPRFASFLTKPLFFNNFLALLRAGKS
jgi:hypothetical protein